jgi:hypothetical protein
LLKGAGIGDLPPIVQPQLVREGQLIEVMPKWRFRTVNLWLVHLGNRFTQRSVRVFTEFATKMAPKLFPDLPTWHHGSEVFIVMLSPRYEQNELAPGRAPSPSWRITSGPALAIVRVDRLGEYYRVILRHPHIYMFDFGQDRT